MALTLAVVGLPAVGAAVTALLRPRWRPAAAVVTTLATVVVALLLAGHVLGAGVGETVVFRAFGLTSVLVADGLAAGLILAGATVAAFTVVFAVTLQQHLSVVRPAFWPLALVLLAALHGLFLAGDLFTAYLLLELVAVAGAALVVLGGDRRRLAAGTRYFAAELVASFSLLAGTALVWSEAGSVVFAEMSIDVAATPTGRWGLALITVGLLLKVPVVPLHFWLPAAHALAPNTVSPLLSGLVVKSAFVVLLRVWFGGLGALDTPVLDQLLGVLGVVAIFWGGLNALRAEKVKQLVAYSTVAQLGLLFMLVPMAAAGSPEAWIGGVVQAIAHALPKAALLMAVALIARTMGGDTVAQLSGAVRRRPVAVFALGLSGLSLVGLPPTGGFVAKWYLFVASIDTGQWWWAAVVVAGSLLTAAYLARMLQRCFAPAEPAAAAGAVRAPGPALVSVLSTPAAWAAPAPAAPRSSVATPPVPTVPTAAVRGAADAVALGLASLALFIGLYPNTLLALLQVGSPLGGLSHG